MPTRLWDVVHLDLDVRIDVRAGHVQGTTTHTLAPLGRPRDRVRFHQIGLDIQAARVDGADAEFRLGPGWVDVAMPPARSATPGKRTVQIDYAADPATGLHFRGPHRGDDVLEVWSQGEDEDHRHWFPSWDHPSDTFTVSTHITVPEGLTARSNGVQTAKEPAETGWTRWSFALEQPIVNYLVAVVAGEYTVVALDGPVPMEVLGPRTVPAEHLRHGADDAAAQIAWFAELFGEPFPYPVYRQVWVQGFLYGGMENASLTTLTDERIAAPGQPDRDVRIRALVAHEVAHQWFGDLLTCYGWRELWLNEGFASFYEDRWLEHALGPEHAAAALWNARRSALHVPGPLAPVAHTFVGEDNDGAYEKGQMILHMLRVHLGTPTFDAGIRRYVAENRFRLVESSDLRRAMEDSSGEHLGWLFDQWVTGPGIPEWTTAWSWDEGVLSVTIDAEDGPVFHAPVEVEIGAADGLQARTIWLDGRQTRLEVPLADPPRWVAVDPRLGVLGRFTQEQPVAAWVAQLTDSPTPAARVTAMRALGEEDPEPTGIAALSRIAGSDSATGYRRIALDVLGELTADPEAVQALLDRVEDPEGSVREIALRALRKAPDGPEVQAALRTALDDADPRVVAAALDGLGQHAPKDAVAAARRVLARPPVGRDASAASAALAVLAEHGTLADGEAALRLLGSRHPRAVRTSVMAHLTGWTDGELGTEAAREKLRAKAAAALAPHLADADQDVREWVIWSLGGVGGPDEVAALERFIADNPIAALDDDAREAIARIRRPRGEGLDVEALRERLDALEQSLGETDERVERLETWR